MADILFFGRLGDLVESEHISLTLPPTVPDTKALRDWLTSELNLEDALKDPAVRIAVNGEIVIDPAPIRNTDEIAFLPPVGGG